MSTPRTHRTSFPVQGTSSVSFAALAAFALATLTVLAAPQSARAQDDGRLSVALQAGTVGLGVEAALAIAPRLTARAGLGWLPFEYDGTFDDQRYSVSPPGRYLTLGADLQLVGPLRATGGLLHRSEPVRFDADLRGTFEVGNQTYTSEGRLEGEVESSGTAPFLGLGFGSTSGSGFGVYFDLAVAFTSEPDLVLEATGPITEEPGFQAELEREQAAAQADLDTYYRYWPVVRLGVRLPI